MRDQLRRPRSSRISKGYTGEVHSVAFSPGGKRLCQRRFAACFLSSSFLRYSMSVLSRRFRYVPVGPYRQLPQYHGGLNGILMKYGPNKSSLPTVVVMKRERTPEEMIMTQPRVPPEPLAA